MKIGEILLKAAKMIVVNAAQRIKVDEILEVLEKQSDKSIRAIYAEEASKLENMDEAIGTQFEQWAGDPTVRPFMQCWTIRVEGKPDMELPETLTSEYVAQVSKEVLENPDEFAQRAGGLMADVRKVFLDNGVMPGVTGIATGLWSYETPVADIDFDILNWALRGRFGKAIDSKILKVSRVYSGWRFNAFPRVDDAVEYARRYSDTPSDGTN